MENNFRLPRKIKKKLNNEFYFYPEKDGGSVMAFPRRNQKDYTAFKMGILRQPFKDTKSERKAKSIAWGKKFKTFVTISDDELLEAVNNVFAEEFRKEAFRMFKIAKTHPMAVDDYHIFVNAWLHTKNGDDCSTTAAMCFDSVKDNLMRTKPRKLK